jgi:hypothetical protein
MLSTLSPADKCASLFLAYVRDVGAYASLDMTDADVVRVMTLALRAELHEAEPSPLRLACKYREMVTALLEDGWEDLAEVAARGGCPHCGADVPCCTICANPSVQKVVDGYLEAGVSGAGISRSLSELGQTVSAKVILRHKAESRS